MLEDEQHPIREIFMANEQTSAGIQPNAIREVTQLTDGS